MPIFDDFYGPKEAPRVKELGRRVPGCRRGWGRAHLSHGQLGDPPDVRPTPKTPINTKTSRKYNRSWVPPPQASVATKNQLGPCSGTLSEGEIPHRWPTSSSRRSPWRGGSSSPSGLRVCTSIYVFDLYLSRVLEVIRSWCIASFAIIVGSYDVSPPLLSCDELSFPLEVILSDWVFKSLRTLDVCLAWDTHGTMGYSIDPLDVCFGDQLAGSVTLWTYA